MGSGLTPNGCVDAERRVALPVTRLGLAERQCIGVVLALLFGWGTGYAARRPPETVYHGARLVLAGSVPNHPELDGLLAATGRPLAHGFQRVNARFDLEWFSLALFDSAGFAWDGRDTIALYAGLAEHRAVEQFVMSSPPEQRIVPLAGPLRPGELWRRPFRGGSVATVVFAGFPPAAGLERVSGVRVGSGGEGP